MSLFILNKKIKKYLIKSIFLSLLLGLCGFIIKEIYENAKAIAQETQLSFSLKDGKTGEVFIENTGKFNFEITKATLGNYKSECIYFTKHDTEDVNNYLKQETKQAINADAFKKVLELESLVVSKGEKIVRQLFSKPTTNGSFCSYDIPIIIEFKSTSLWANLYLNFLKLLDLIDPKQEIYIRFDGCEFSQIGKKIYEKRNENIERIQKKLEQCFMKYSNLSAKKMAIEEASEKYEEMQKNKLKLISNNELVALSEKLLKMAKKESSKRKVSYCYEYKIVFQEMKDRALSQENIDNALNYCMN